MGVDFTRDFNSKFYITPILATEVRNGAASESATTAKLVWGCRGGAFLVEVLEIESGGTIYLTFQKSPDNSTWTDLVPIGYSSADIEITDAAGLGEDNIVAFSTDELNEGGYVRVQHYNTSGDTDTGYGANFIGFRGIAQPPLLKWREGETYVVDDVVQNDGFYFKCILAFGRALAESEVTNDSFLSEPGVGASTGTYWEIYKGAAL